MVALEDRPRPGKEPTITVEAKAWLISLACRKAKELGYPHEMAIGRSRTEPASRVERARMLLAYRDDPSFFAVGQALGVHHQTVQRCIARAVALGPARGGVGDYG